MAHMYCRHCGERVKKINGNIYVCPNHEKQLTHEEVINGYTLISRKNQLELMHKLMQETNDESIYLVWITTGVPDCPSDDDFLYIASNDEAYNETFDLFVSLIADNGNRY